MTTSPSAICTKTPTSILSIKVIEPTGGLTRYAYRGPARITKVLIVVFITTDIMLIKNIDMSLRKFMDIEFNRTLYPDRKRLEPDPILNRFSRILDTDERWIKDD